MPAGTAAERSTPATLTDFSVTSGAVVARDRRDLQPLADDHGAIVRERLEANAVRQEQRLLELGFLPREAEVDFVPRRIAQPERGQLRAKIANGSKTGSERRRSSGRSIGRDGGGRGRDARADRLERRRQRGGRRRTGVCAKPVQRRIDAVEHARRRDPGLAHDCIRQLVGARRRLPRQEQQLGRALALVHAARFEAKLAVGAAEQRVESGRRHAQQIARGGGGGGCP